MGARLETDALRFARGPRMRDSSGGHNVKHALGFRAIGALVADSAGNAPLTAEFDVITIGGGSADVVGKGVIVHMGLDDFKTQPAGNSGAGIACGVIRKSWSRRGSTR
jgi:Cu/Zn superoxide dismutase